MARILGILAALLALVPAAGDAQQACSFQLGFRAIADQIPDVVGRCLENEWFNTSNGNAEQRTTAHHGAGGLLVWRKADNWTAFTDGHWTWVNGPWEAAETAPPPSRAPGPPPAAIPTPRSTITAGGLELVDMVAGWGRDQQGNHLPFIRFRAINRTNDVIRYPDDRLFFSATFVNAALGETTDAIGALPIDLSGIRPGFGGTVDLWGARGYVSGVARSQLPALKVELYHGNPIGGNRRPIGVFDLRP